MRDMSMLVLGVVCIYQPLLQLSVATYLHRRQLGKTFLQTVHLCICLAQNLGSTDGTAQHVEHNLIVHRRTSRHIRTLSARSMFWRNSRHGHHPSCRILQFTIGRIFAHIVCQEISSALHHGIVISQKLFVACKQIVLPQMRSQPSATRGEHTPRCSVHRTCYAP